MITERFKGVLSKARDISSDVRVCVAGCDNRTILETCQLIVEEGLGTPFLVAHRHRVESLAQEAGVQLRNTVLQHVPAGTMDGEPYEERVAAEAVRLVREGGNWVLIKGSVRTDVLLKAVLNSTNGLRQGKLLTHVAVLDLPSYDRFLFISDGGVVVSPGLEEKAEIVTNAVHVARALGVDRPKVAILSASEAVSSSMQSTLDAACLRVMGERKQLGLCEVDGPLALDVSLSQEAARIKGIESPVAGRADVLIAPNIEAGNLLAKCMNFVAGAMFAGVVVGARCPIVITSRADPPESKLVSVAVAVVVAGKVGSESQVAGPPI